MHYHPYAQNLWFPLAQSLLIGIAGIPLSLFGGSANQIITAVITFILSLFGL